MKTIIFREDFTPETAQKLINEIEQPNEDPKEYDIRILFSNCGGEGDMAQAVVDCINELPAEFDVEFVVTYQVISAAFDVFVKLKCKKRLYPQANAIVHLFTRQVSVRETVNATESYDKFLLNDLNVGNAKYLKWLEGLNVFSLKELKGISKGRDVYLGRKRLQKIIDNQKS